MMVYQSSVGDGVRSLFARRVGGRELPRGGPERRRACSMRINRALAAAARVPRVRSHLARRRSRERCRLSSARLAISRCRSSPLTSVAVSSGCSTHRTVPGIGDAIFVRYVPRPAPGAMGGDHLRHSFRRVTINQQERSLGPERIDGSSLALPCPERAIEQCAELDKVIGIDITSIW